MALLSDELYESTRNNCGEEYVNVDPSNALCLKDLQAVSESISQVNKAHILEPKCVCSSNCITGDSKGDFFVELWDVSGHERYKEFRSLFYSQVNGVIFVYNLSQRRTKTSLQRWASEVAATGTFSAPLGFGGPGGLPVPYIVIGNKADIGTKEGPRGSNGNLVGAARQWVEKKGLLPSSEELPLTESFPSTGGLLAAAKESRFDKEAVIKFFRLLIRRRYFPDELPPIKPMVCPSSSETCPPFE